jgi:hypothetical protein
MYPCDGCHDVNMVCVLFLGDARDAYRGLPGLSRLSRVDHWMITRFSTTTDQTFCNTTMCYYRLRKVLLARIVTQLISVLIFNVTVALSIVTQYTCSLRENVLQLNSSNTTIMFLYRKNVFQPSCSNTSSVFFHL